MDLGLLDLKVSACARRASGGIRVVVPNVGEPRAAVVGVDVALDGGEQVLKLLEGTAVYFVLCADREYISLDHERAKVN